MYKRIRDSSPKHMRIFKQTPAVCVLFGFLTFLSMTYLRNAFLFANKKKNQNTSQDTYIDNEGICVNALPYAKLHHNSKEEVELYKKYHIDRVGDFPPPYGEIDPPELRFLPPGSSFAHWDCEDRDDCDLPFNERQIKGSAWSGDGRDAFDEGKYEDTDPRKMWVSHDEYEFLATKRTTIRGDVAAMFGFFPDNFGHVLHDNFPLLAWLKSVAPKHSTFALPDTKRYRELINFIDPEFLNRIYFYQPNELITVEDGLLTVARSRGGKYLHSYGNTLLRYLRHWIFDNHPETYPDDEKYLIFYIRGGSQTYHGRQLEKQHEQDVIAMIRSNMKKYKRKEKLIMFTGMDEVGKTLSYTEQFHIFRRASTVIGPHGSGLANIVWTDPFPKSCNDRVQMLEFMGGTEAKEVQPPIIFNGYYGVLRGMPIDWHNIAYASNSTIQTTFIRLDDLQQALDDMWGKQYKSTRAIE